MPVAQCREQQGRGWPGSVISTLCSRPLVLSEPQSITCDVDVPAMSEVTARKPACSVCRVISGVPHWQERPGPRHSDARGWGPGTRLSRSLRHALASIPPSLGQVWGWGELSTVGLHVLLLLWSGPLSRLQTRPERPNCHHLAPPASRGSPGPPAVLGVGRLLRLRRVHRLRGWLLCSSKSRACSL